MRLIVISTLAEYQTVFWENVSLELKKLGYAVAFISFDDRSSELLVDRGYRVLSLSGVHSVFNESEKEDIFNRLHIHNPSLTLSHERYSFGIRDTQYLENKFCCYWSKIDAFFKSISKDERPIVLQELGGFISVLSSWYAARNNQLDVYFIEPSFFKGRQFFLKNSIAAPRVRDVSQCNLDQRNVSEVKKYIDDTMLAKSLVIPNKDKHHYSAAYGKILKLKNVKRLFDKLFDKYILRKHQEFGHIGFYALMHVKMVLNDLLYTVKYQDLSKIDRYIYFPLHVPGDVALTLRSPEFLDQLFLIDYLSRNLPRGYKLVVKEHPAQIGAINYFALDKLLRRYDDLLLLNPNVNNFDVMSKSSCVISINSKSGAEAALLGKPVLVLGDAFYSNAPFVNTVDSIHLIFDRLVEMLSSDIEHTTDDMIPFFSSVWAQTYPGELYDCNRSNIVQMAESIQEVID